MVSRITRLSLPIDDEAPVAGWDATIDPDVASTTASTSTSSVRSSSCNEMDTSSTTTSRSGRGRGRHHALVSTAQSLANLAAGRSMRTSLSPHAMAHEHWVCGIRANNNNNNNTTTTDSSWIAWKTSLAPHRVCQVASNASGNLIAATLDNGTLSILRGTDGTVLATRRVAPEGTRLAASVEFVVNSANAAAATVTDSGGSTSSTDSTPDTLMIVPPEEGPPIMVSNMQGDKLNQGGNPGVVAEAARSMGLHALRLEGCDDIRAMRGLALLTPDDAITKSPTTMMIRLAVVDGDGRLAIYDYDVKKATATLVERNVNISMETNEGNNDTSWEIDLEVGLRVQVVSILKGKTASYLLFCKYSGTRTKVCWLNLDDLTVACEYDIIPQETSTDVVLTKRPRILALESVAGCSALGVLAIVLTIKFPGGTTSTMTTSHIETRVLQAAVGNALDEAAVHQTHIVYTIPVPPTVQSMAIASVSETRSAYAFLCKTWSGNDKFDCHLFQTTTATSSDISVGSIRLLCAKEKFLEAQELLIQSQDDSLVKDPFAQFHSSEITVKRLDRVLDAGSVSSPQAVATSQECLHQLVKGVLSGNSLGQKAFLAVADRILNWPDEKVYNNKNTPPSVQEVVAVLEGMIAAMASVANAFAGSEEYAHKAKVFEERLLVMKYVQSILQPQLENEDATTVTPVRITKAFADVQSFKDLFASLVQNNYFAAAEKLARSNLRSKMTAESMASSVLAISPRVRPRLYYSLLVDTIFPSLSIGHELLPPILSWACKTADAFDVDDDDEDNENTLDDAIFLLESAERATKDLRMRLHSSFSMYTPFVEKTGGNKRRKIIGSSNIKNNSNSNMINTTNLSFSSLTSAHSTSMEVAPSGPKGASNFMDDESEYRRPNPTILEMGRLKGGAQKTRIGGQQQLAVSMDAVDETEDTVEFKLSSARCLKYARSLGLDSHLVTLGTFAKCGGVQHIAQELVKMFSESSPSHKERIDRLCRQVQPFCARTGANLDDALTSYAQELCGGKTTRKRAIEEAASVARCGTTASTKCQVTLIALKAALFCRFSPPWLSKLSQEAIEWAAGDSSLRSELEEASRLLLIDGIVGRYCGEGAKELFHVDNPRHAIRLLQFVAQHFAHESVLEDSLDLCDAFAHLSREDACSRILENAILKGDEAAAAKLLATLYDRNILLARAIFSRVVAFCIDLIEEAVPQSRNNTRDQESSPNNGKKQFSEAVSCALALTSIALSKIHSRASTNQEGFSTIHFDEAALENLLTDLKRLSTLHKDHSVCLPLSALCAPKVLVKTISNMLTPVVDAYLAQNATASSTIITQAKRACSLLSGSCQVDSVDLWYAAVGASACRLAMKSKGQECLSFMSDLGVLEAAHNSLAARSCIAVALSFCLKASKMASNPAALRLAMKHIIMALSLLQDHAVLKCPMHLLDTTLSVAELCDVVTQVLVRSDEGIGEELDEYRKTLKGISSSSNQRERTQSPLVRRTVLQSTWYIGDGLLLPPLETLTSALQYCKQALRAPTQSDAVLNLVSFVDGRGAYSLGLRLLTVAAATQMSTKEDHPSYFGVQEAGKRIVVSLAERYVGGTSNGITSGIVDSQMAVSVLLCLPLKMAFSVYKSSLPTAISTRDFSRVITLANVGITAGTGRLFATTPAPPMKHWARQGKFVVQCRELALRAKWWKTLQECGVQFDPNRFQDSSQASKEKTKSSTKYVVSLLPSFISSLSQRHPDPQDVFKHVIDFADAFGLERDVPVQKYVAYLLSPPNTDKTNAGISVGDIRLKFARLDSIVKSFLRQLESQVDRVTVLRECLLRLEEHDCCYDYERLSVVLTLYQSELSTLLMKAAREDVLKAQVQELELIDRRRDALAILSWFFQGDLSDERPSFSELFLPLPQSWDCDYSKNMNRMGSMIVGQEASDNEIFDPLRALEKVLNSSKGATAASVLAPLCLPLGVPRGYIHARSLINRFKRSKETGAALPSFEDDVLPVLNRLKSPDDVADLAEWCSCQYQFEDENKLHCLDHSLTFALKASSESEAKYIRSNGKELVLEDALSKALDRVKRITAVKDMLADRLAINAILQSVDAVEDQSNSFGDTVKILMATLDATVWQKDEFVPEDFVEIFITEASLMASEACLDGKRAMSIGQLRQFSVLVQRASTALADKYSHVQVESIACRLARRWLFYGDQNASNEDPVSSEMNSPGRNDNSKVDERALQDIDEDDTMNFVMDLNALQQGGDDWATAQVCQQEIGLTSEEEPKILCGDGSAREVSDYSSRRAALRIAFVMTFAGESATPTTAENPEADRENQEPAQNTKIKVSRLRSKLSATGKKDRSDSVLAHSRELLRIVFARSVASGWIVRDLDNSFDSKTGLSFSRDSKQTITFAMRHRALRVASILCPQDALQQVVDEEELMHGSHSSLIKSAFASFVAKEVEEMGLPLPHSDLAQLSTMHFPSYARTLWRHHRDDKRSKGRLLLLILEMYMKEHISDHDFFLSIVSEMNKSHLPRTLLLALECICDYLKRVGPDHAIDFIRKAGGGLATVFRTLSDRVIQEVQSIGGIEESEVEGYTITLSRLAAIMHSLYEISDVQAIAGHFVNKMLKEASSPWIKLVRTRFLRGSAAPSNTSPE